MRAVSLSMITYQMLYAEAIVGTAIPGDDGQPHGRVLVELAEEVYTALIVQMHACETLDDTIQRLLTEASDVHRLH